MEAQAADKATPEREQSLLLPFDLSDKHVQRATGSWWLYVLLGVVSVAVGATALASQISAVSTLVLVFAAYLFYAGAAELAFGAMSRRTSWLAIVTGLASIAAGIIAVAWPGITLFVLAIFIGASLLSWGFYDIYLSLADPVIRPRAVVLVQGIALAALGVFALARPNISIIVLAILVGVFFIVYGAFSFVAGLRLLDLRQQVKRFEAQGPREAADIEKARTETRQAA
jgi:uncharacterized membrane protein HdeD (DUF308 family)